MLETGAYLGGLLRFVEQNVFKRDEQKRAGQLVTDKKKTRGKRGPDGSSQHASFYVPMNVLDAKSRELVRCVMEGGKKKATGWPDSSEPHPMFYTCCA